MSLVISEQWSQVVELEQADEICRSSWRFDPMSALAWMGGVAFSLGMWAMAIIGAGRVWSVLGL